MPYRLAMSPYFRHKNSQGRLPVLAIDIQLEGHRKSTVQSLHGAFIPLQFQTDPADKYNPPQFHQQF